MPREPEIDIASRRPLKAGPLLDAVSKSVSVSMPEASPLRWAIQLTSSSLTQSLARVRAVEIPLSMMVWRTPVTTPRMPSLVSVLPVPLEGAKLAVADGESAAKAALGKSNAVLGSKRA